MEIITDTVKNLVVYLIFITIIKSLIGDSPYGKYAELFMGMVMILIIAAPVGKLLNMEGTLESYLNFNQLDMEMKTDRLSFYEGEEKVNDAILKNAKEQIQKQLKDMAAEENIVINQCEIVLSADEASFGSIESMELWLSYGEKEMVVDKIVLSKEKKESDKFSDFQKKITNVYEITQDRVLIYEA